MFLFPPDVIFRSRVIGAFPVSTDCIVFFQLNDIYISSTTSQCPSGFFILPRDTKFCGRSQTVRHRKNNSRQIIQVVGKSGVSVPGTRAQQKPPPEK